METWPTEIDRGFRDFQLEDLSSAENDIVDPDVRHEQVINILYNCLMPYIFQEMDKICLLNMYILGTKNTDIWQRLTIDFFWGERQLTNHSFRGFSNSLKST